MCVCVCVFDAGRFFANCVLFLKTQQLHNQGHGPLCLQHHRFMFILATPPPMTYCFIDATRRSSNPGESRELIRGRLPSDCREVSLGEPCESHLFCPLTNVEAE